MVRYTVTDSKLQIDTGLIARTTRNIPLSKVQDVTVQPAFLNGFWALATSSSTTPVKSAVQPSCTTSAVLVIMPTFFCVN